MRGNLKPNNKSNVTISVDKKIFDEIKKDAENQGQSINALLNNMLTKYVLLYRPAEEQQGIILPHKFFSGILEYISDDGLIELLYEEGFEAIRSIFVQGGISLTMDNMIIYFFERIGLWAGTYRRFRHYVDKEGYICLAFEHSYGIKWSKALGVAFSDIIRNILNHNAEHKVTSSTLLVRVVIK